MSLILIDGTALVYRAYYAFANRPLTAPSGEQTSVIFGFCNSVLSLIERYEPEYLTAVFDLPGKTFRHEIYSEYKANRKPMPEDLAEQLPRLREFLLAWGLPIMEKEGFEADDVMATIARRSAGQCDRVWFYTGDKDFMQLLNERTGMLKPGRRGDQITEFTPHDVNRHFGLQPAQLVDVFALSGDKSDNIPGAPGVGEKTATKLIRECQSLDDLYKGLDSAHLTPRLYRVLTENQDQVFLSRDLFIIDQDVPLTIEWSDLTTILPTGEKAQRLLEELGLRRIQSTVQKLANLQPVSASNPVEVVATDGGDAALVPAAPGEEVAAGNSADSAEDELARRSYALLETREQLAHYLTTRPAQAPLAVDTETDSLRPDRARLVGISLASPGHTAAYIPVLQRKPAGDPQAEETGKDRSDSAPTAGTLFDTGLEISNLDWVQELLAPPLASDNVLKIGQNLKYDEWILTRHGLPLGGDRFDTMVAAYVLDPGRQRTNMDGLAAEFLGEELIPYAGLFEVGDRQRDILNVPLPRLALYAAEDADVTLRLYEKLQPALVEAGLEGLFEDLEMPLSKVLFTMEHNGIKIDTDFLAKLQVKFAAEMTALEQQIHAAAGEPFNIQSPKQLAHILFEKIKLKPVKKTATGWSTDVSVMEALSDVHPLPALILEYRQLAKLQSTYVQSLPKLVNPHTGLIHTSYNQAVAATGRLSSSDPNLQNIPIRSETGRQIRQAFVPRSAGNSFLSADYSQIELRLLAHLSGDENLTAAFLGGGDVHRRTAALIDRVSEDEVTDRMRYRAKAINFGVIYGMGAVALGKQITVTTKEAKDFIQTYFATYPGVKAYIDQTKEQAREIGYVETLLGRRRLLPDILSPNNRLRSFQERIAVNTPIQGTAADLIKLAMIRIDHDLKEADLASMLLLQVHDELVLEVPAGELETVQPLVRKGMETVMTLNVPLVVDIHTGKNWAEAHG